jgi:hypothetical protein
LAIPQLLLCPANAAFSRVRVFGVLDPADELVAGQRRDVLPSVECRGITDQCGAQVRGQLMYHPSGNALAAHEVRVTV